MRPMLQSKVTKSVARQFIENMAALGYEVTTDDKGFTTFSQDGEVNINYSVFVSNLTRDAYIGIRPQ